MKEVVEMAKFLFEHKTTAHIDKKDKEYYNGLIIELHETFLVLNDRVLGETPITFSEIDKIEKYKWGDTSPSKDANGWTGGSFYQP